MKIRLSIRAILQNGGKDGKFGMCFELVQREKWTPYSRRDTGAILTFIPGSRESITAFGRPTKNVSFLFHSFGSWARCFTCDTCPCNLISLLFYIQPVYFINQSLRRCSHFINEADTTVYALNARDSDAKCKFETQNTPKQLLTTPGTFRKRPLASR